MAANTAGMTGRDRLQASLNHQSPDRVCVDFGATFVTGIHVSALTRLRNAVLGDNDYRVRVSEPYQMLGEVDDELRKALGIDVVGVLPRKSIFGTEQKDYKPFTLNDGTNVLVPGDFNVTIDQAGDTLIYPEGDTSAAPSGRMPEGGYFFDAIIRQELIGEGTLNPEDNMEEFGPLCDEDLAYYRSMCDWFDERKDCGTILIIPGSAFGDIALIPAPFLKKPKGIRDIEEWYISTVARKDYVLAVFERQCEIAEKNIESLIALFGDRVQVALTTGTDFGTQMAPFLSPELYRELYKPFHVRVNRLIHERSQPLHTRINRCLRHDLRNGLHDLETSSISTWVTCQGSVGFPLVCVSIHEQFAYLGTSFRDVRRQFLPCDLDLLTHRLSILGGAVRILLVSTLFHQIAALSLVLLLEFEVFLRRLHIIFDESSEVVSIVWLRAPLTVFAFHEQLAVMSYKLHAGIKWSGLQCSVTCFQCLLDVTIIHRTDSL